MTCEDSQLNMIRPEDTATATAAKGIGQRKSFFTFPPSLEWPLLPLGLISDLQSPVLSP